MTINIEDLLYKKLESPSGQEYILALDYVSEEAKTPDSVIIKAGTDGHASIWMEESVLSPLHEQYPGIPVFGLWQVLIENNDIDDAVSLQIMYAENASNGHYVLIEYGVIHETGKYINGFFPQRADLHIEDAMHIEFEQEVWDLPAQEALLLLQIRKQQVQKKQRFMAITGGVCLIIVALAFSVDFIFSTWHKKRVELFNDKKDQLGQLHQNISLLRVSHIDQWPKQAGYLEPLIYMHKIYPNFSMLQTNFDNNVQTAVLKGLTNQDPIQLYPWLKDSEQLQDGSWQVKWQPPLNLSSSGRGNEK